MLEIFLIVLILYTLSSILYWTLKNGISPMWSNKKVAFFFNDIVKKTNKSTIVDLGSGWGTLALFIAVNNPEKKVTGYELSPIPFYFSKLLKYIFKAENLEFYKADFLEIEFNEEDLYLSYLYPKGMKLIENKIKSSKNQINLLSSTFALPNKEWDKKEVLNDMFKTPIYFYYPK